MFLTVYLYFLTICVVAGADDQIISQEILKLGKQQFEIIEEKSRTPNYGDCWTVAVERITEGCKTLTDVVQVDLALQLTSCFLDMSGQGTMPQDCLNERTEPLKRLCMSEMPDRIFSVYTEFFTQSQHMCYFLQNQVWHSATEKTIIKLSSSSKIVSEQLAMATDMQSVLLDYQKQGLDMQEKLLNHGENLSKSLNTSQMRLERLTSDLKTSTQEHLSLLEDVFHQFYLLQNWLVGKHTFLDRIVFYTFSLLGIIIITSSAATQSARIHLILNLMLNYAAEYFMYNNMDWLLHHLSNNEQTEIDNLLMDGCVWQLRKVFIILGAIIFLGNLFSFENVQDKQLKVFKDIQSQNMEILEKLDLILNTKKRDLRRSLTPAPANRSQSSKNLENVDEMNDNQEKRSRSRSESPMLADVKRETTRTVKEYLNESARSGKNICIVLKPIVEEDTRPERNVVRIFPQRTRRLSVMANSTGNSRTYQLRNRSSEKNML